jgi:hypothetical protein
MISSARLGYVYDDTPSPDARETARPESVAGHGHAPMHNAAARPGTVVARSAATAESTDAAESHTLRYEPERVVLESVDPDASILESAAVDAASADPPKILVEIEDFSFTKLPNFVYGVYVNLPEGVQNAERMQQYYAGSINLFGRGHQHGEAAAPPEGERVTFDETIDVTEVVARQQAAGLWEAGQISVTLRPLAPIPPPGQEEALRQQAVDSAEAADIRYGRINIRIVR